MQTKLELDQLAIVREVTLTYKPKEVKQFFKIASSSDACQILKPFFGDEISYREHFLLAILNNANQVLGVQKISTGGMTGTVVDVRIVFQTVLKAHGVSMILAHNHPSGTLKPSNADISITNKILQAGRHLDIKLLDHLIITRESYYSLADNGDM